MTVPNWFGSTSFSELCYQLYPLSDRKLHLLTAALLRRVWDDLPSDHARIAVAATEAFADGRMTADELARLRSVDLLEAGDALWSDPTAGSHDTDLIGTGCWCCECGPQAAAYECRVARAGYVLDGVRAAVREPTWTVIRAAARVRELLAWQAGPEARERVERAEADVQHRLMLDIGGGRPSPDWPRWRTWDVRALAGGIYRDRVFDRLPILADALQDAGCDDEAVLWHCRAKGASEHVRGCWVVDLAMGFL